PVLGEHHQLRRDVPQELALQGHDPAVEEDVGADLDLERLAEVEGLTVEVEEVEAVARVPPVAEAGLAAVEPLRVLGDQQADEVGAQRGVVAPDDVDHRTSRLHQAVAAIVRGHLRHPRFPSVQWARTRSARAACHRMTRTTSCTIGGAGCGSAFAGPFAVDSGAVGGAAITSNSLILLYPGLENAEHVLHHTLPWRMCLGRESAMERRYELRLEQMLAQAEVSPELMQGLLKRLDAFAEPFAKSLTEPGQQRHAAEYMAGLLSKLERKTGEAIAYLHDQERQGLQKFVGHVPWDHKPLLETLALQVGEDLGESDAVIVFDPSAFPKKGTKSVGVAQQWCGRLGKVDNCQVGVFMAYVSGKGHTLVNTRLYLHKEWTKDRARCKAAGVPKEVKFRTRHQLALEMLDECGKRLPHSWVAGDDE